MFAQRGYTSATEEVIGKLYNSELSEDEKKDHMRLAQEIIHCGFLEEYMAGKNWKSNTFSFVAMKEKVKNAKMAKSPVSSASSLSSSSSSSLLISNSLMASSSSLSSSFSSPSSSSDSNNDPFALDCQKRTSTRIVVAKGKEKSREKEKPNKMKNKRK